MKPIQRLGAHGDELRVAARVIVMALVMLASASRLTAQAVQGAIGAVEDNGEWAGRRTARNIVASLRNALGTDSGATRAAVAGTPGAFDTLRVVQSRAARAVSAAGGREFAAAYEELTDPVLLGRACTVALNVSQLAQFRSAAHCSSARRTETGIQESVAQIPGVFVAVPEVVFTVGYEHTFKRKDQPDGGGVSIGTNMLGAAVGTAFDAIGSSSLQDYFKKNLSAGLTIPTGSDTRMSGALGVGLGKSVTFRDITIWPTLSFEQLDTADARVPDTLHVLGPKESRWSQPALSVAIVYPRLLERISDGRLGFIGTIGIRLPHYYAGDTFSAVGALFSSKRSDFRRAGGAQFTVGIAIPLLPVKPIKKPADSGNDDRNDTVSN
jgi:hypothetical protein